MTDTNQASEDELDEILIRFGVSIAEYANFGSPSNSDDENIAGAEALYQTSLQEAEQAILDWHNKKTETLLDELLVDVSSPNANIDQAEMIELINLYINKLKESK